MERRNKRSDRDRFKYGICLNEECPKCKEKEVQKILMRKDFVCAECGKELRECPPPRKSPKKSKIILVVAILLLAIIGCIMAFTGGSKTSESSKVVDSTLVADTISKVVEPVKPDTVVVRDTIMERDTIVQNNTTTISEKTSTKTVVSTTGPTKPKASSSGSGTLRLSYGTYTGATKNGYPHGQGKLTYSTSRQINRNDMKGRTANAGDYVIGEFFNGFVVYGKHYDSAGNLLGSLNFGVGSESSYESK